MKKRLFIPFLALSAACIAEDVTLTKATVLRVDHSLTSLKAGTVVTIVARGDKTITVTCDGKTGTIPASSLPGAATAAVTRTPPVKTTTPAAGSPATPASKSLVADHPQSVYGNLVKKAETNAAKNEANLVKPANEVMDDSPQK